MCSEHRWKLRGATAIIISGNPMPNSLSAALSKVVLPDLDDREVRLGSLWAKKPAVIVFLRHYG